MALLEPWEEDEVQGQAQFERMSFVSMFLLHAQSATCTADLHGIAHP